MNIERTESTNTLLKELIAKGQWPEDEEYLRASYQTAGRGQQGNGWESAPDENLLCSILLPPRKNLFELNVIASVAVCLFAKRSLSDSGLSSLSTEDCLWPSEPSKVSIKWPNDIYWQDKKLAGILIENAIIGNEVKYSIAGIGLNVNQTEWQSDAPNPVSLRQITGETYDLNWLMNQLLTSVREVQSWSSDRQWAYYRANLYRREGYHPYVEREVTIAPTTNASSHIQEQFLARIEDILPTGEIVLRDQNNQQRIYHFKQIRYIL